MINEFQGTICVENGNKKNHECYNCKQNGRTTIADNLLHIVIKIEINIKYNSIKYRKRNINIVEIKTKREISVITNERGVGITLACGTGACASVVARHKLDLLEKKVVVKMPGGSIKVEIMTNNHILMTGNATKVFEGKIDMDELKNAE